MSKAPKPAPAKDAAKEPEKAAAAPAKEPAKEAAKDAAAADGAPAKPAVRKLVRKAPEEAPPMRVEEAIEIALASASTAVDSAHEIQRLRREVDGMVKGARRNSMILLSTVILLTLAGGGGMFGTLVMYKRSLNDFEALTKVNADGLRALAAEINGITATAKQMDATLKTAVAAGPPMQAAQEEVAKALKLFTASQNTLSSHVGELITSGKTMTAMGQSLDEVVKTTRALSARLESGLQQRAPAPAPARAPAKPRDAASGAQKPKPLDAAARAQAAAARAQDKMIRYP